MLTRRSLLLLVAAFALAVTARADDSKPGTKPATKKIENPRYASWAQFKVGAFVELTTESDASGTKGTMKRTLKLVELTAEKAVIETTMATMMGGKEYPTPPHKEDVPKTLEIPDVKVPEVKPEDKPKVTEGTDTIEVVGKKIACKTWESTTEMSGMKTWVKSWLTKEIPDGTARMESKTEGKVGEMTISSTSTTTVTKFGTGG